MSRRTDGEVVLSGEGYSITRGELRDAMLAPATPMERASWDDMDAEATDEFAHALVQMIHRMTARPCSYASAHYLRRIT